MMSAPNDGQQESEGATTAIGDAFLPAAPSASEDADAGKSLKAAASADSTNAASLPAESGSEATAGATPDPEAAVGPSRSSDWDPVGHPSRHPSPQCLRRVQQDIAMICRDPPLGCFVFPDECQSTVVHCLVTGNEDTPYMGGMFYFYVGCPDDYPMHSPRVKIMTGCGKCRFNPNLYQSGKVCLSILNTWSGPSWQPTLSIAAVLMSIQSLMNDKPYHNEPGFETERYQGDVESYNRVIQHETIRHAVLGMMADMEAGKLPSCFKQVLAEIFLTMFEGYVETCEDNMHLDGQPFRDPFGTNKGSFQYGSMLKELRQVMSRLEASM